MKYEYKKPDKPEVTVEVTVPSGNIFLFVQPSKYELIFSMEATPSALTETAIEKWKEVGVGNDDAAIEATAEVLASATREDRARALDRGMQIRDKVLELSRQPKLVVGPARNPGELSTIDVDDDDLGFLFRWVASGGVATAKVADFRGEREPDALASAGRRKVRAKAVAVSGNE